MASNIPQVIEEGGLQPTDRAISHWLKVSHTAATAMIAATRQKIDHLTPLPAAAPARSDASFDVAARMRRPWPRW